MSRLKIHDLFDVARKLKIDSQRIDQAWIRTQRACVKELRRLENESVRVNKHLTHVLAELAKAGFTELEVATGRIARTRFKKKGKKS